MKSIVLKSAWSIFRTQNVTFSQALQMAWKIYKNGIRAIIVKCNKLVKSAGLGYETICFNELQFVNISTVKSIYNNDGAQNSYDGKTFNND